MNQPSNGIGSTLQSNKPCTFNYRYHRCRGHCSDLGYKGTTQNVIGYIYSRTSYSSSFRKLGITLEFGQEREEFLVELLGLLFRNEVSCTFDDDSALEVGHKLFESWTFDELSNAWEVIDCVVFSRDVVCLGCVGAVHPWS